MESPPLPPPPATFCANRPIAPSPAVERKPLLVIVTGLFDWSPPAPPEPPMPTDTDTAGTSGSGETARATAVAVPPSPPPPLTLCAFMP